MQVDPIKPTLKASGTRRLKPKYDEPLSNVASRFNLRRYNEAEMAAAEWQRTRTYLGRASHYSHESPPHLNLSRCGLTHLRHSTST